jgi:hypothetical protein
MAVIVPGSDPGIDVTVTSGTGDVLDLGAQIGALLADIQASADLGLTSVDGSQPLADPDPSVTGGNQALLLTPTDTVSASIPGGYD